MIVRPLNLPELGLLIYLLRSAPQSARLLGELHTAEVVELNTSGIGTLRFLNHMPNRHLGERIASTQFLDEDGVQVFAALYLDQHGELYELDCWKADDTPVVRIPAF
ncbi:DUF6984 family protein [Solirubrum puertoriconensis]|uniref:DUF6984 domain-containing protein n=1 Tax=Solirubrum puertoriconensis TaxID=1751427 RepID=A0A9X0HMV0_SOLP1|nr:hypothetical protein [Solirubrum puertoriconensis]KUG08840.1 hypothetical protein ASU33_11990 [Solirubrum puertoriconensis]